MPNWCYTQINFHGERTELEDFRNKLEELVTTYLIPNGFGTNWLGNVLHGVGLGDRVNAEENRLYCRGCVTYIGELLDGEDSCFTINTETAWAPCIRMWVNVIEKLGYNTVDFSFQAEEIGMQLFVSYDPYGEFNEMYYVDVWLEDRDMTNEKLIQLYDNRYYDSDDALIQDLQKILDTEESNLQTLIDRIEHYQFKDSDSYISVNKYYRIENLESSLNNGEIN